MHFTILSAAVLGSSLVSALPAALDTRWWSPSGQVPFAFPLSNGFPDITIPSAALTAIEVQAHGTLPNSPLATHLASEDITVFQLIAFNEIFEVAFFSSLYQNITSNVSGYEAGANTTFVEEALYAIIGQEQLHALGANAVLTTAGATAVQPCEYVFPVDTLPDAINLARTFTDVVLGTLQSAQTSLATYGDSEYINLLGGVIGQEGEQVGFFRSSLGLVPSELPFLTNSAPQWAYSILNQMFVVPGSCPNAAMIDLPIFPALTVVTSPIAAADQTLSFSFTTTSTPPSDFSLVYTNQQNIPVVETPSNVVVSGNTVTFDAALPYTEYLMNGLTIAAVTSSAGPFTDANSVAAVTLAGPGLIEIM